MSLWQGVLAFAALVGLVVDGMAIVRGNRQRALGILAVLAVLVAGLILETAHVARVEAENSALTDAQARAQRLIDTWSDSDEGFSSEFNSRGTNEGIASAAADLMEDVSSCRPNAAEEARDRLKAAREQTAKLDPDDSNIDYIWRDAADAAYQQVLGVSEVAPDC